MPRFEVKRSIEINAAPEDVFDVVADFRTWKHWSPWLCAEPDTPVEITENPNSVGSVYRWSGNMTGAGEVEHLELERGKLIDEEIRFTKPWSSKARVGYELEPVGTGTRISWYMDGSLPWFMFWMVKDMQGMIAMDYDRGLKMLKEWIETGEVLSQSTSQGVQTVGPVRMIGVRKSCNLQEIGKSMEQAFCEVQSLLTEHNIHPSGPAISIYHNLAFRTGIVDYTSGCVVDEIPNPLPSGLTSWSTPQIKALVTEHVGSYDNLGNAWSAAHQRARYEKLKLSKIGEYELYLNSPEETPPAELRTEIYLPLK